MSVYPLVLFLGIVLSINAFPEPDPVYNPNNPVFNPYDLPILKPTYKPIDIPKIIDRPYRPIKFVRVRRFTDGSQRFDGQNPPNQKQPDWEVRPDISRDNQGNTRGQVTIQKHGENHDFEAGYGQTIRGPEKHSETWHVGGNIRW